MRRVFAIMMGIVAIGGPAHAQEANVAGLDIPGLHQKNGEGLYDKVLKAAAKKGATAVVEPMAPNRAFHEFESGNMPCVSPANKKPAFYDYGEDFIQSTAMFEAKIYIFTSRGSEPIRDLDSLKGKTVGIRSGMPYGKNVMNSGLELREASTIEANIAKLKHDRIDAFIAFYPDSHTVFHDKGMEPLPYAADHPVEIMPDRVVCHDTQRGRDVVDSLNKALAKLEESGRLSKLITSNFGFM